MREEKNKGREGRKEGRREGERGGRDRGGIKKNGRKGDRERGGERGREGVGEVGWMVKSTGETESLCGVYFWLPGAPLTATSVTTITMAFLLRNLATFIFRAGKKKEGGWV